MTKRAVVSASVDVAAPAERVFLGITAWERQGEWMLGTSTLSIGAPGVGQRLAAYTGVRPFGFLDTMTVTEWDPPRRCVVEHTGRLVRGWGIVTVAELEPSRSRLELREELDLPYGIVGRLGFPLVRPAFVMGVRWSLRRFARLVEDPNWL